MYSLFRCDLHYVRVSQRILRGCVGVCLRACESWRVDRLVFQRGGKWIFEYGSDWMYHLFIVSCFDLIVIS